MAVSKSVSRPAPFVEALGTLYSRELPKLTGTPIDTSQFAPTVATYDAFQQAGLQNIARQAGLGSVTFDPKTGAPTSVGAGTGIAGYEPYLKQAAAYSGPQAYQQFMSPYQQDVIDASLAALDREQAKGIGALRQQAVRSGAFGGGREAAMLGEYQAGADIGRASLEAQLRQQGFQQGQQGAQTAFGQQTQLGGLQQQLAGTTAGQLMGAGTGALAYKQAVEDAASQAARMKAYEPYERLGFLGSGIAGVMGGMGQYNLGQTQTAPPSPLQTALSIGSTLGGIYGAIRGT